MRNNGFNEVQKKIMALRACPACGSENLVHVDHDVVCGSCPWNSAVMSVEAGELDDLMYEYEELSSGINKPTTPLPTLQRISQIDHGPENLPGGSMPKFKKVMGNAS
jgi:hypothetical protein